MTLRQGCDVKVADERRIESELERYYVLVGALQETEVVWL